MKPTIGRIVIFHQGAYEPACNGTREHPAIITRVWSDTCVNLHVFFDGGVAASRASASLLPTLPEGVVNTSGNSGWSWPERIGASERIAA